MQSTDSQLREYLTQFTEELESRGLSGRILEDSDKSRKKLRITDRDSTKSWELRQRDGRTRQPRWRLYEQQPDNGYKVIEGVESINPGELIRYVIYNLAPGHIA